MTIVLPNLSLQQQPVPLQFFIARNRTVGAPCCEIRKVGHHYGRAIKRPDEDGSFVGRKPDSLELAVCAQLLDLTQPCKGLHLSTSASLRRV